MLKLYFTYIVTKYITKINFTCFFSLCNMATQFSNTTYGSHFTFWIALANICLMYLCAPMLSAYIYDCYILALIYPTHS